MFLLVHKKRALTEVNIRVSPGEFTVARLNNEI